MADYVHRKASLLFAAVLCFCVIAALGWLFWSSYQYRTYGMETHDSVHGLVVGAPVEFHGVEVGKVTQIELVDPTTVQLWLSVAKDAPVSKATVATITARGLAARGFAGYVYVALDNNGTDLAPLSRAAGLPYPVIASAPSRIATLDSTAAEGVKRVEEITPLLASALNEKTIASLKRTLVALQEITGVLQTVLDEKTAALLKRSFGELEQITHQLTYLLDDSTIVGLKHSLGGLQEITATLVANNSRLDSLIANAERDSREMRPLVEASSATVREMNTQVLPQFYRTMGDIEGVTRVLDGLVNRLARNPSVLLRGTAAPPGPGER